MAIKKILTAIFSIFPNPLAVILLNLLGHKISKSAYIGFSIIYVDNLIMKPGSRIGHLNVMFCDKISMGKDAYFGRKNLFHGPFNIELDDRASIGNNNKITRGKLCSVTYGGAVLKLGALSKITANHRLDLTMSVYFDDFSTLAGTNSEIWTHGYIHTKKDNRYRVDGSVKIGESCYLASRVIVVGPVNVASGIQIGVGCVISKDLSKKGLYVNQPLRYIEFDPSKNMYREDYKRVTEISDEIVFKKISK